MALSNKTKKIVKPFKFIPINFLKKITKQKAVFPFYHAVSDNNPAHLKNLYKVKTSKEFIVDLDCLLKEYKAVSLEELHNHINGKTIINKPFFFLSFDDGLREIKDFVAPILKEKGIPAGIFINSDFVDNKVLFHRFKASIIIEKLKNTTSKSIVSEINTELNNSNIKGELIKQKVLNLKYNNNNLLDKIAELLEIDFSIFLKTEKPYLSKTELIELSNNGFSIGAHSANHAEYYLLNKEEQIIQTQKSINYINENFKQNINSFAFPFTDDKVPSSFFDEIYNNGVDISFGTAGLKKDIFKNNIQRIPFEEIENAKEIIKNEYLYYCIKSIFGKNLLRH